MNRWLAPPQARIIETRQIVMNQRGTMQQLQSCRSRQAIRQVRFWVAGMRNGETQFRADMSPARKDGMLERLLKFWWTRIFRIQAKGLPKTEVYLGVKVHIASQSSLYVYDLMCQDRLTIVMVEQVNGHDVGR